jgi:hypothetical protein
MQLASRNGRMYIGPCPFCAEGGEDRFHVWMEASGGRPAERYWCRVCNARGRLAALDREGKPASGSAAATDRPKLASPPRRVEPTPAHTAHYRELDAATALWAHAWLLDECHPDPLRYLHRRGLSDAAVSRHLLGVTLRDPQSLVAYLRETCPDAFSFAEEAGLLVQDDTGQLRTHWNLCGRIVFPYIADGEVVDLRTRTYDSPKGYRSLGPYEQRGVSAPFAWDSVTPGTKTVVVAEAEFKALAVLQAFHAGELAYPAIGQPGLTVFRAAWAEALREKGVDEVVLCYDHQPRENGALALAPEEQWSLRHGATCAAAGLGVRIARLPLPPGAEKAEIDTFIRSAGIAAFQQAVEGAPLLDVFHRGFSRALLERHQLPVAGSYPTRRPRPQRLAEAALAPRYCEEVPVEPQPLAETRTSIAEQVERHATDGEGLLVLAHPPGTGKGHNTIQGLRQWLGAVPSGDDGSGFLVWTALRKAQLNDQEGIPLIPLHGRDPTNCRKLPEAIALAQKGYSVKDALCMRRCPHVGHCAYLRQFEQEGDFFAAAPMLKSTGWWKQAGVLVLDEFDPASLIQQIQLDSTDLAAMSRAHSGKPAIQALLRWVAQAVATTLDRVLSGVLWLDELAQQAGREGAEFDAVLQAALDELPPPEQLNMLIGLPTGARLADYQALPPSHTATLLQQLAKERGHYHAGRRRTSRIEARDGRLFLHMRAEHLIAQLARPEQPKIILDATANLELLQAIFPETPLTMERPTIAGGLRIVQVIGRDWAKSTLRAAGAKGDTRRQTRWFDEVAGHIRPDRPTLVVCTREWEETLRAALVERGHTDVKVAHYGALRGSNAYQGHDVILAQVYHPNLEQVVREGRALFADDATPLDERIVLADTRLQDATGASWLVPVPTFADVRLQALLAQRREAELLQCALRGRPFDHPDAQITLLFSLPVPGLPPSVIVEAAQSPESNAGREAAVKARLCAAAQQLLDRGMRVLDVNRLATAAHVSVVTVRKHWGHVAARLHLRSVTRWQRAAMPRGGERVYERMVLVRRGRWVPPQRGLPHQPIAEESTRDQKARELGQTMRDQARKKSLVTRPIRRVGAARHRPGAFHGQQGLGATRSRGSPGAALNAKPPPTPHTDSSEPQSDPGAPAND